MSGKFTYEEHKKRIRELLNPPPSPRLPSLRDRLRESIKRRKPMDNLRERGKNW